MPWRTNKEGRYRTKRALRWPPSFLATPLSENSKTVDGNFGRNRKLLIRSPALNSKLHGFAKSGPNEAAAYAARFDLCHLCACLWHVDNPPVSHMFKCRETIGLRLYSHYHAEQGKKFEHTLICQSCLDELPFVEKFCGESQWHYLKRYDTDVSDALNIQLGVDLRNNKRSKCTFSPFFNIGSSSVTDLA